MVELFGTIWLKNYNKYFLKVSMYISIIMAMLKNIVDFYLLLIGAEDAKTPVGVRFRGDPAGASAEEARRNAHGKRSVWSGNQQTRLTEPLS
jgi:hypothetical protein